MNNKYRFVVSKWFEETKKEVEFPKVVLHLLLKARKAFQTKNLDVLKYIGRYITAG